VLLGACAALLACASSTDIRKPCCYTGDVTLAKLASVHLVLKDGTQLPFETAFVGFESQTGLFTTTFPDRKISIAQVTYASLIPVLPVYDANEDGWLQTPELTVLYIREAAIGMGHEVDYIGVNPRVSALTTSAGDFGGLMEYVKGNEAAMSEQARQIFSDLERVGEDWLRRGSENSDSIWVP
jgi:hypothetical protein